MSDQEPTAHRRRRLAELRLRLESHRTLRELSLHLPGATAPYDVAIPADPDGVLDELVSAFPHMPYWATLWPSGLALAEVVLARRDALHGATAIELGCGLGVTATAVTEAGADLVAVDCFPEALMYCRYNVLRNAGAEARTLLADWRTADGRARLSQINARVVLAADVLYEQEDVAPLLELGEGFMERGAMVWLAEPGRVTSERFVDAARERGWRGETIEMQREWPAHAGTARVRVHLFGRGRG
ncbi:MAG TPA: methyltransferase type 12 [Chloroflexota bacterium]|nr:methyltransferase type 12 [Chloroflexota bacterium]